LNRAIILQKARQPSPPSTAFPPPSRVSLSLPIPPCPASTLHTAASHGFTASDGSSQSLASWVSMWRPSLRFGGAIHRHSPTSRSPDRGSRPSRALHNYKAYVPPSSALPALSAPHSFVAVLFRPQMTPLSPSAAAPQPRARYASHLFLDTSVTTLVRLGSHLDLHPCSGLFCSFAHPSIPPSSSAAWPSR
jgi:hypothetical protein